MHITKNPKITLIAVLKLLTLFFSVNKNITRYFRFIGNPFYIYVIPVIYNYSYYIDFNLTTSFKVL